LCGALGRDLVEGSAVAGERGLLAGERSEAPRAGSSGTAALTSCSTIDRPRHVVSGYARARAKPERMDAGRPSAGSPCGKPRHLLPRVRACG